MIEIRWVVTGWDVSTGLLNIWVAVTFLLSLLWYLSHPADENIILLCEKEKVRIGTCLVDRLRCYYRKDCGRSTCWWNWFVQVSKMSNFQYSVNVQCFQRVEMSVILYCLFQSMICISPIAGELQAHHGVIDHNFMQIYRTEVSHTCNVDTSFILRNKQTNQTVGS